MMWWKPSLVLQCWTCSRSAATGARLLALPCCLPPPATSRFSRDHLSDAELARLLRWWESTERSAADINGDGMVDASEAALQVEWKRRRWQYKTTHWELCLLPCRPSCLAGSQGVMPPHPTADFCVPLVQERAKPKALRVQGRVVAEDELRRILQAGRGAGLGRRVGRAWEGQLFLQGTISAADTLATSNRLLSCCTSPAAGLHCG